MKKSIGRIVRFTQKKFFCRGEPATMPEGAFYGQDCVHPPLNEKENLVQEIISLVLDSPLQFQFSRNP